jgi:hypothetical protein
MDDDQTISAQAALAQRRQFPAVTNWFTGRSRWRYQAGAANGKRFD